jgi:acyl carrier protein
MQNPQVLARVIDTVFTAVKNRADRSTVDPSVLLGKGGLGLDSVDILEVVVAIEHDFRVKVADKSVGETVFQSLESIARFVAAESPLFTSASAAPAS